jgi:serine/threonine-protein kinase
MNPLLDCRAIDGSPPDYLRSAGEIFAEFGALTQDSGNISYGVRIGQTRYFVKTAGIPDDPVPFLAHPDRVALLRNAVQVAQSCSHPTLPTLHRAIESSVGPLLVYEWVEGESLGVPRAARDDPQSSYQRFRSLPLPAIMEVLDALYDLHRELAQAGWIAVDFYDGSMVYDFSSGSLSIVDLDHYHPGPFTNAMGRMFGSTRFMAPEEFELGAVIDERTNVFVMGRAAALFLADGTLEADAFRGSDALYRVVAKACEPERSMRFASMAEFHDAWKSARNG